MPDIRTIGVLTSGGDAPGMNAAIRAVVRAGIFYGMKVFGIQKGYNGLIHGDFTEMTLRSVSDIIHRGGTILQTARCPEFKTEEGIQKAVDMARVFGIDAIVVIGGDGSYRGARDLSKHGLGVIGLPGTIDNDIGCTDYTIGFDTACNTVQEAIDKIRDTAYSHERCSVLEVMGRHAGYIALNVGIAGGAEVVLLPEKNYDITKDVIKPIIEGRNRGKKHYVVIVAEGVGGAIEISNAIEEKTGIESRATILGHIQRGGSPTVYDRVMASRMGVKAVELLKNNITNRIVALKDNKIVDIEINEALEMKKNIDESVVELSRILAL
ncbi:6-phosphofructokinase [Clostridium thermosuccinogenes]|jgi:6-phosphofructokinase 1|uniref:ATP-dependent 6-phosphofructokinase n=1 Tax=Clostridium thermosuccinogenes TaxID=84032 RepID=A0A2K2FKR3_9CLOT|nr:6-phosphofructokinase [Pseudoclostridium thermosuccinogenes]AUS95977.1 6-phosphofructokinase [Pseudoclostridium thermosuccinogenes]PNT93300.1 6-phosphofructokinase [Pseudoclostridium thermosuccinogenes]PNT99366.1 6-phosphofructokinase [Pseudoclostridium thermosuccinogenes]PNU01053.1 6-phosphofructokinase [Pseudoclostridium thermosuccinogenes]